MPKTKMVRQKKKEEREKIKIEFAEKLADIEKQKHRMEFEINQLKEKGELSKSFAYTSWVAANAYTIYGELESVYRLLGNIFDSLYESNLEMSKISSEWQKNKKIITRYKQALDFTDETLLGNK